MMWTALLKRFKLDQYRQHGTAWIVGGVFVAIAFGPGAVQQIKLAWQQHVMDRRLLALQYLHDTLTHEQERLTSDPVYLEGLTRSTFKIAKPGELVVPLASTPSKSR